MEQAGISWEIIRQFLALTLNCNSINILGKFFLTEIIVLIITSISWHWLVDSCGIVVKNWPLIKMLTCVHAIDNFSPRWSQLRVLPYKLRFPEPFRSYLLLRRHHPSESPAVQDSRLLQYRPPRSSPAITLLSLLPRWRCVTPLHAIPTVQRA